MSDKSISDDAKEYLSSYGEGIFDILDIEPKRDTTIYKLKNTPEIKYIAIGLFFAGIVHIYSFINYGWKPILYTPFFIKEDPFIFISWLGGVGLAGYGVYNILQSRMKGNDREYDSSYRAIHSAWHTYRNLQQENLSDAVNFWENGGYYTQQVGYNGPDELRNLYEEYSDVENKIEFLRENLPPVLEEISGSEISEVVVPYDYFRKEHQGVVTEINKTYNTESYRSCSVMIRNLCETLLTDILKREFDENKIMVETRTGEERPKNLVHLIQMFNGNLEKFEQQSQYIEFEPEKFKRSLDHMRQLGNEGAHNYEELPDSKEDVRDLIQNSLFALYVLSELDMRTSSSGPNGTDEYMPDYDPGSQVDTEIL